MAISHSSICQVTRHVYGNNKNIKQDFFVTWSRIPFPVPFKKKNIKQIIYVKNISVCDFLL